MPLNLSKDEIVRLGLAAVIGAGVGVAIYKVVGVAPPPPKKQIRVFIDGCFDLMHFGHANAFRQARTLGDYLIVGMNMDDEITRIKGPPIMTESERKIAVEAIKWVDEVITDVPYVMDAKYLEWVIKTYNIDYVVHGDDPCIGPDGKDVYAEAKLRGKYREIKRTEGISTTDIIGRMLSMTKEHHIDDAGQITGDVAKNFSDLSESQYGMKAFTRISTFLPTSSRIVQFSSGKSPNPGDRIVYVPGVWDLFHPGHILFLKECRKFGEFVLVGIHRDDVANKHRGSNYPILNLHERSLGVMSCRYVDEVIIGAPWEVTKDIIVTMGISVVVAGTFTDCPIRQDEKDPYIVPKQMGILKVIKSPSALTTGDVVARVQKNHEAFQQKFDAKHKKEETYLENKKFVQEL